MHALVPFVQQQFRRVSHWCWETVIEEIAGCEDIPLDDDRLTYVGGVMRTGKYWFVRNDARWRAVCDVVVREVAEADNVIQEILAALRSNCASGVAGVWFERARAAVESDDGLEPHADALLKWNGHTYRPNGESCVELQKTRSVVYGLWRMGSGDAPVCRLPHYIGEAAGTVLSRVEGPRYKCHRDWWGDGKPIGITVVPVEPQRRREIEERLTFALNPFCDAKRNRLLERWTFPRP